MYRAWHVGAADATILFLSSNKEPGSGRSRAVLGSLFKVSRDRIKIHNQDCLISRLFLFPWAILLLIITKLLLTEHLLYTPGTECRATA